MAKKNNLIIIGAVLFGLLAVGLTAYVLMGSRTSTTQPGAVAAAPTMVGQWVAGQPISPRTVITRSMLEEVKVDAKQVAPNAITDVTSVQGKLANQIIQQGQPITSDLVIDAIKRVTPANIPVPGGFRAVAIWVDPDQTAAGLVDSGDRVDVVVNHKIQYKDTKTGGGGTSIAGRTIAQDLLVLGVDRSINASPAPVTGAGGGLTGGVAPAPTTAPPPPTGQPVRTRVLLAARPADAERIVAANEGGTIHLTIRNPGSHEPPFPIPQAVEYPARLVDTLAMEREEKLREERRKEIAAARERQYSEQRAQMQYERDLKLKQLQASMRVPPMPIPKTPTIPTGQQPPVSVKVVTVIRGTEKTRVVVPPG